MFKKYLLFFLYDYNYSENQILIPINKPILIENNNENNKIEIGGLIIVIFIMVYKYKTYFDKNQEKEIIYKLNKFFKENDLHPAYNNKYIHNFRFIKNAKKITEEKSNLVIKKLEDIKNNNNLNNYIIKELNELINVWKKFHNNYFIMNRKKEKIIHELYDFFNSHNLKIENFENKFLYRLSYIYIENQENITEEKIDLIIKKLEDTYNNYIKGNENNKEFLTDNKYYIEDIKKLIKEWKEVPNSEKFLENKIFYNLLEFFKKNNLKFEDENHKNYHFISNLKYWAFAENYNELKNPDLVNKIINKLENEYNSIKDKNIPEKIKISILKLIDNWNEYKNNGYKNNICSDEEKTTFQRLLKFFQKNNLKFKFENDKNRHLIYNLKYCNFLENSNELQNIALINEIIKELENKYNKIKLNSEFKEDFHETIINWKKLKEFINLLNFFKENNLHFDCIHEPQCYVITNLKHWAFPNNYNELKNLNLINKIIKKLEEELKNSEFKEDLNNLINSWKNYMNGNYSNSNINTNSYSLDLNIQYEEINYENTNLINLNKYKNKGDIITKEELTTILKTFIKYLKEENTKEIIKYKILEIIASYHKNLCDLLYCIGIKSNSDTLRHDGVYFIRSVLDKKGVNWNKENPIRRKGYDRLIPSLEHILNIFN